MSNFKLGKRWFLAAFSIAVLAHLTVLLALFWLPTLSNSKKGIAVAAGTGGIEVSLGPAGRSAGTKVENQTKAKPEKLEPKPINKPKPEVKKVKKPKVKPKLKPKPQPKIEPKTVAAQPAKTPEAKQKPVEQTISPASQAGNHGKGGDTEANNVGNRNNTAGGGLVGSSRDYTATLKAWLERHQRYPKKARYRRQQGTVKLFLKVDKLGNVLDFRIEKSSGYSVLDTEVLAMLQRAKPLPAMPDNIDKDHMSMIIPVEFNLREFLKKR